MCCKVLAEFLFYWSS